MDDATKNDTPKGKRGRPKGKKDSAPRKAKPPKGPVTMSGIQLPAYEIPVPFQKLPKGHTKAEQPKRKKIPAPRVSPNQGTTGSLSAYTEQLGTYICECLIHGMSLRDIAKLDGMPEVKTILCWVWKHEAFGKQYREARKTQAEHGALEIRDLADEKPWTYVDQGGQEHIDPAWNTWQANRIKARTWIASKLLPKVYGERLAVDGNQTVKHTVDPNDLASLNAVVDRLKAKRGK
jgi:hypothetical protein